MHSATKDLRGPRIWFYIATIVLVATIWLVQIYINRAATVYPESSGTAAEIADLQKMTIQAMTAANGLLTTLGTALLGALGLLIINSGRDASKSQHKWAAFLAALGGGVSLYYGYLGHMNLLWMISNHAVSSDNVLFLYSSHAQFYTLLAGAFFFADFAVSHLS
jgi:hypothetical protein